MAGKPKERPHRSWSMRRLRGYQCAWCEQRLDQAARGFCGAIYGDSREHCNWIRELKPTDSASDADLP